MTDRPENVVQAMLERDERAQQLATDFIRRFQPFFALPKEVAGLILLGYGWRMQTTPITEEAALAQLRQDVARAYAAIREQLLYVQDLSSERVAALFHLAFVLGTETVVGMAGLWSALRRHDYDAACDEIMLSEWPKFVGHDDAEKRRALAIVRAMRTGSFHPPEAAP